MFNRKLSAASLLAAASLGTAMTMAGSGHATELYRSYPLTIGPSDLRLAFNTFNNTGGDEYGDKPPTYPPPSWWVATYRADVFGVARTTASTTIFGTTKSIFDSMGSGYASSASNPNAASYTYTNSQGHLKLLGSTVHADQSPTGNTSSSVRWPTDGSRYGFDRKLAGGTYYIPVGFVSIPLSIYVHAAGNAFYSARATVGSPQATGNDYAEGIHGATARVYAAGELGDSNIVSLTGTVDLLRVTAGPVGTAARNRSTGTAYSFNLTVRNGLSTEAGGGSLGWCFLDSTLGGCSNITSWGGLSLWSGNIWNTSTSFTEDLGVAF